MSIVWNFLLGSLAPYLAAKLLKPERLAQLGYDVVSHWTKKTPSPDDDKFLNDIADFLELKRI